MCVYIDIYIYTFFVIAFLFTSFDHPLFFSPPEALDRAFKRLDADISLEAQVPLSNDLMKSTAIQVIPYSFLSCFSVFKAARC